MNGPWKNAKKRFARQYGSDAITIGKIVNIEKIPSGSFQIGSLTIIDILSNAHEKLVFMTLYVILYYYGRHYFHKRTN